MRLIDADALMDKMRRNPLFERTERDKGMFYVERSVINVMPTIDAVEVVRCHDCIHAVPLERNCELNTCLYMHCNLWRGDETKNVWHKYKRFYKDYSLVEHDDFCSYGERKE